MKLYLPRLSYGGMYGAYVAAFGVLVQALRSQGIVCNVPPPLDGESLVTRGRNRIAHAFRATDCDAMMLIDTDIVFTPRDVERLLSSGHEFVGAPYPTKQLGAAHPLIGTLREPLENDGNGFWRARDVGTGFVLMQRSVFDTLAKVAPTYRNDLIGGASETVHAFYDTGIDGEQYLSEDWWISRAFSALGGVLWLDGQARLGHIGMHMFTAPSLDEVVAAELEKAGGR